MVWRAVDVEQLLEPDHLARAIWEMTGRLDLTPYTAEVRAVEGAAGRPPYDPRLLISAVGLCLQREGEFGAGSGAALRLPSGLSVADGVRGDQSSHPVGLSRAAPGGAGRVVRATVGGLEQRGADHAGAGGARRDEGESGGERQVVSSREDLAGASGGGAAAGAGDGGSAGRGSGRERSERAQQRAAREKVARLEQALEELQKVQAAPEGRAEPSERRASETDAEARVMKQGDGGYAPSHNVQISTDTAHSIIVGASVTQETNDQQQRVPAVEEVEKQNGRAPDQMIVDDGYTTRENVLAADERSLDLIGSRMEKDAEAVRKRLEKRGLDPAFYPQNFSYDPQTNAYTCPQGKRLPQRATRRRRAGVVHQVYQARAADCRNCALRAACRPGKQGRLIVRSENVPAVAAYVAKMQTEAARAAYRRRAPGGGIQQPVAEGQAGTPAVLRAGLAESPLRGPVGLPHLQYSAMVSPALESAPERGGRLKHAGERAGPRPPVNARGLAERKVTA